MIISLSFSNTAPYREYREYRLIKCCTKFAPKLHQHSTPIQLNKLEFIDPLFYDNAYDFCPIYNGYDRGNAQLYESELCHRAYE